MNENRYITGESLIQFHRFLQQEERSAGTIEKYMRDVKNFAFWIKDQISMSSGFPCCEVTKDTAIRWKQYLLQSGRAPSTVNSMLAAVNTYFKFMSWQDLHIKAIRLQRSFFRSRDRELTKTEYEKLISAARRKGDEQLVLLMETICATGIRVSEVRYITREAAAKGRTQISLKGKLRMILIPGQLCQKLQKYARKKGIGSGELFLTTGGRRLDRRQIWAKMKALCGAAGVAREKVFPHNLRHLFARCFYRASRDISALANMLGHSSIETTRIYLISTGAEHMKILSRMHLIQ